jgi:hypothetical protein
MQAGILPVVLVRDGKVAQFLGTGFAITEDGLVITADHVISEIPGFEHAIYPNTVDNEWVGVICLDHSFSGDELPGAPSIAVPFEYMYRNPGHDVAAARTRPTYKNDGTLVTFLPLKLDFTPPRSGDNIVGLGYPDVQIHPSVPGQGSWTDDDITADLYGAAGTVLDFLEDGMGTFKPFPHAWTNADLAKGMSGGPVVSEGSDKVCGIIHAGLPDPPHVRDRTTAFCISGIALDLPVGNSTPEGRPDRLIDLIRQGIVYGGPEFEQIEEYVDEFGDSSIRIRVDTPRMQP